MKRLRKILPVMLFSLIAVTSGTVLGQSGIRPIGFVDADRNGINDLFADADGDGVNDVTSTPYTHPFKFKDADGDGINDIWVDADGDGVNDKLGELQKKKTRWVDTDGDGIAETQKGQLTGKDLIQNVLDSDRDGKNDITGIKYSGRDLSGYRYGNVYEETGTRDNSFSDINGDGMNDNFAAGINLKGFQRGRQDVFIDADGDGIADDRGIKRIGGRNAQKGKR